MRSPSMLRGLAAGLIAAVFVTLSLGMPVVATVFDVPVDDFYTVNEDHQLVVPVHGVFSNDPTTRGQCVAGLDLTGLQGHLPLDSLGANGEFVFSPNPDFNGATSFKYTLGLVGGECTAVPEPNTATVTITVFELNDPPAILLEAPCSNNITVAEDSGPYDDAAHCVEMLNFGPLDENNQSFDAWLVSSTHPELFAAKPKITQVDGLFGRLTFTPAPNARGTSTVSIRGRDGGGATDGGDDTSDPEKFKITITAVDDPATPGPPTDEPTVDPTPEVTAAEPSAAAPTEVIVTLAPSTGPSPEATPVPGATAAGGEIPWVPIVLGILLVVLLIGFGAALVAPKWRANRRG